MERQSSPKGTTAPKPVSSSPAAFQSQLDKQADHLPSFVRDLLRAEAYPHEVYELSINETHISWVILTGPYAYKIKKPVTFDFMDASTLERRRHYCKEELRLNRRLAPELYIDVVAITLEDGRAQIGGTGQEVEYAVLMQQFDASDELPALLTRDVVQSTEIATLAETLAEFHLGATSTSSEQTPEKTEQMFESVLGNVAQLLTHADSIDSLPKLGPLADWTRENARTLSETFQLRERNGFIRECHGDLHAGNIVKHAGRLIPFDCIEFATSLRWIDVLSDLAFLVMDLASRERADLAFVLLSRYLEITGDYDDLRILPFYAVYRALVRAKIDALRLQQDPADASVIRERLHRRIRAAEQWTTPKRPTLVLMHGVSASGKSWLSERLVPELRAIRIRSDLERKRLAGIDPSETAAAAVREGIYAATFDHRTYSRLAMCADSCLRAGFNIIIDAASLRRTDRDCFRSLATQLRAAFVIVSCHADPIELATRIDTRSKNRTDPSDANLAVLDAQLREFQPFDPVEQQSLIAVNTLELGIVQRVASEILERYAPAFA